MKRNVKDLSHRPLSHYSIFIIRDRVRHADCVFKHCRERRRTFQRKYDVHMDFARYSLAAGFAADYVRQFSFLTYVKKLAEQASSSNDIGQSLKARKPRTGEQALWTKMINALGQQYESRLSQYINQQKQHYTFTNQWVHHMKTPVSVISLMIQEGKRNLILFSDVFRGAGG